MTPNRSPSGLDIGVFDVNFSLDQFGNLQIVIADIILIVSLRDIYAFYTVNINFIFIIVVTKRRGTCA